MRFNTFFYHLVVAYFLGATLYVQLMINKRMHCIRAELTDRGREDCAWRRATVADRRRQSRHQFQRTSTEGSSVT